jgi:tRNA modification GTPase
VGGYSTSDTIVAPATALVTSALGMVRLSGPTAWQIVCELAGMAPAKIQPQRAYLVKLALPGTSETDDAGHSTSAVVVFWRAPISYTGEDLVELTVHGNPLLVQQLCNALAGAGARPAEAGEFTYRAMLNGKLDLAQAEAVQELITAGSARAMLLAEASLAGTPSRLVEGWTTQLTSMLANIEVIHDYAADDLDASLDPADLLTPQRLRGKLDKLAAQLEQALEDSRRTAPLRAGITVAITGPPNVGKSTLFNALLGHERAITDCAPGTTRDYITETVDTGGISLTLVDTAGYRDAASAVEAAGVRRTGDWARAADRVLWVTAADMPPADIPPGLAATEPLRVATRCDLLPEWPEADEASASSVVYVSGKTGRGIPELWQVIHAATADIAMPVLAAFNQRQASCIAQAADHLHHAIDALGQDMPLDAVAQDLYQVRSALAGVYQQDTRQAVIDEIFRGFCVGK